MSAIYSQLGNAYFYLGDYVKAMQVRPLNILFYECSNVLLHFHFQYHKHDLTLARTMGDRLGEAKASGNLGNTLKVRTHYSLKGFTTLVLLELKSAEKLI